jgi:hypothetical protein
VSIWSLLKTFEQITRPPKRHTAFDDDLPTVDTATPPCYFCGTPTDNVVDTDEGAEFICEGCATPADEPVDMSQVSVGPRYCGPCDEEHDDPCTAMFEPSWAGRLTEDDKLADMEAEMDRQVAALGPYHAFGFNPNPPEPTLTDDELVAVRGLIQERYDRDQHVPLSLEAHQQIIDGLVEFISCRTLGEQDSAAPSPAAASPAGVEHPPVPPAGHSHHDLWPTASLLVQASIGLDMWLAYDKTITTPNIWHELVEALRRRSSDLRNETPETCLAQHPKPQQ